MTEQIKQIAGRIKEIREISGISAETLAVKLGLAKIFTFRTKAETPISLWALSSK